MPSTGLRVFDGAAAIVTGAASGIGRALSEQAGESSCGRPWAALGEKSVHVLSGAVHVLVHGLRATTVKLDGERAHDRRCDRVREPETVYVYK